MSGRGPGGDATSRPGRAQVATEVANGTLDPDNLWSNDRQHYERLIAWRRAMVHRGYEKIELSGEAGIVGAVKSEWREPSTIFVRTKDDGPHVTFDLPGDLATCVILGMREFRAFCAAVSEVAVAHPTTAS